MVGQALSAIPESLTPEAFRARLLEGIRHVLAEPSSAAEVADRLSIEFSLRVWELAEDAAHGSHLREAARRGAAETNRPRIAASRRIRVHCIALAKERMDGSLPYGVKAWTVPVLAAEVREGWKLDGYLPAPTTVEKHLRIGLEQGALPAWLKTRGGAPESRLRGRAAP